MPVVLVPLGAILLAIAHLRSSLPIARVALGILIAATIVTVPAFLLGEGAEEIIEHLPGIAESMIEEHEEGAEPTLWIVVSTGLAALVTWIAITRGSFFERALLAATFILSCIASISLAYTAHLGGLISHPEIRSQ